MRILKKCCGLSEILAQPVDKLCTFSKMVPNNAQITTSKVNEFCIVNSIFDAWIEFIRVVYDL